MNEQRLLQLATISNMGYISSFTSLIENAANRKSIMGNKNYCGAQASPSYFRSATLSSLIRINCIVSMVVFFSTRTWRLLMTLRIMMRFTAKNNKQDHAMIFDGAFSYSFS